MIKLYNAKKQEKKMLAAAVAGGLAGAGISLFVSPLKGSQARRLIANRAKRVAMNIENKVHESLQQAESGSDSMRSDSKSSSSSSRSKNGISTS
jgi:gas vesicle protein